MLFLCEQRLAQKKAYQFSVAVYQISTGSHFLVHSGVAHKLWLSWVLCSQSHTQGIGWTVFLVETLRKNQFLSSFRFLAGLRSPCILYQPRAAISQFLEVSRSHQYLLALGLLKCSSRISHQIPCTSDLFSFSSVTSQRKLSAFKGFMRSGEAHPDNPYLKVKAPYSIPKHRSKIHYIYCLWNYAGYVQGWEFLGAVLEFSLHRKFS